MSAEPALLIVLAGPNGAGKSTFFDLFLRRTGLRFVNADLIARAIAPESPVEASYEAAAVADAARRALLERRESFCMETVFSDPAGAKLRFLKEARRGGYRVHLIFIGLDSVELSEARVIQRVSRGGHDVPHDKIVARFPRTLANLKAAVEIVDLLDLYDNSDAQAPYRHVATLESARVLTSNPPLPAWARAVIAPR